MPLVEQQEGGLVPSARPQEQLGFRGAIEVGYKATSWFYPTLRVGYNARTINHAGFAAGLALVFDW